MAVHAQRVTLVGLVAALSATTACAPAPSDAAAPLPPVLSAEALRIDTLATQLVVPWGLALAPDGRLFVTERAGRLRVIDSTGLRPTALLTLPVHAEDESWHPESGLMGIALDPAFASNGHVYVMATFARADAASRIGVFERLLRRVGLSQPTTAELAFESHVLRLTLYGDSVAAVDTIVRSLRAFHYHAGGAVAIGPDNKLYVTVGDVRLPSRADDADEDIATVLRFELDGSVPSDNPSAGSPVWARGLRNTQALGWTNAGQLFGVDHGPSGLPGEQDRAGRDELNLIERGKSYGWPTEAGPQSDQSSAGPTHWWPDAVAPAGLAVLPPDVALSGVAGDRTSHLLVVGRLRGGLEQLTLSRADSGFVVVADTLFPLAELGRIRSLLTLPDGSLYATTSNRDIRGSADSLDDLVVRIRRAPPLSSP